MPKVVPRVKIQNSSDGGLLFWLAKLYLFAVVALVSAGFYGGLGLYLHFARQVPAIPELASYLRSSPGMTTVYGLDGSLLAEFATERREIVSIDKIPQQLIDA